MANPKLDPEIWAHLEWLGFVRPTGLVVSAPALVRAGAILDRRDTEGQRLLRSSVTERVFDPKEGPVPYIPDFRAFAQAFLGWSFSPRGYAGTAENPIPPELEVPLPNYGETLRPDFAVRELEPKEGAPAWQLVVRVLASGEDFDRVVRDHGHLEASAHGRMERLLRHTGVPAGILFNGRALRLISAPRGESSGWIDFRIAEMVQTAGRPISTALRLLLGQSRLLSLPRAQRLPSLLEDSRRFQNEVSERLAEQVLHALYELLRGFQAAHDASRGALLRETLSKHPDEVYRALLTVILRLVFLLYAGERDMLPEDETFLRYYSLPGLHERLREDAALYPDTMDDRYSAWAQLLVLFRMVHDGAASGPMQLPRRHGVLFDPDRYPFLEGRSAADTHPIEARIDPPLVPDGTVYRALEKLLVLDGERISYRALDVEQIGSVYETMMGFRLETAAGRSVAIKAQKAHGAPTTIDLDTLLGEPAARREKWIAERSGRKITATVGKVVARASTLEDLHAALLPVIDSAATPDLVPAGALVLQPSEERRRSGSHYTPRVLTEPIVRKTLEPILAQLGENPTPDQILDLKVCDPAMGSGAFLVETCRQLADALVEAWHAHGETPVIPPDEDEVIFARRLIAQRCLYGVDKNPMAVDLAKVSLWLATLARDHPLTFLDHSLRCGDSLVGLTRAQIVGFTCGTPDGNLALGQGEIDRRIRQAAAARMEILQGGEWMTPAFKQQKLLLADSAVSRVRLYGDLAVAAFFNGSSTKERAALRSRYLDDVLALLKDEASPLMRLTEVQAGLRSGELPITPFHWEIEFPEVFDRKAAGFDAIVGNPPFAGKNTLINSNRAAFLDWLKTVHEASHGNADLVAHFFRRAFTLLRPNGCFGLIATNTVGQGDTRVTGLRWICTHGGTIYSARKRYKWPGQAAVVVSVVHISKGSVPGPYELDGISVPMITAYLFHAGSHENPRTLHANAGKSFQGSIVLGMGFTFDDTDKNGVANPVSLMHDLIERDPRNAKRIFPFIGYAEVASSPTHAHHRCVINFEQMSEDEARQWPDLMRIVEEKVKGTRASHSTAQWWHFERLRPELYAAIAGLERVLVAGSQASTHFAIAFLPRGVVYSSNLSVVSVDTFAAFASLQTRVHEVWARFFMSTMKDDLAYTPTSCFEPFPFPVNWETYPALEATGKACHEFRSALMVKGNEGLTQTYNRLHDPEERDSDILKLRDLHAQMDRAVLDTYGWTDIPTECDFFLEYEDEEEDDGRTGKRKKPWRYRWPDSVRDEVLARLLKLNARRAEEERLAGLTATGKAPKKKTAKPGGGLLDV